MAKGTEDEAIDVDSPRSVDLSVAIGLAISGAADPPKTFDKRRRRAFIEALAAGATFSEAAAAVGITANRIHHVKAEDPKFAEACALAIEAGADPVLGRMQAIARFGKAESMATVRAAEVYLKAVHPAFRDARAASVTISRTHPDGSVDRIQAKANGIPE